MDDVRERVRRELTRLEPSPGGFEKTIRRVRARQRTRRAGAATVGLTLTALLVVGLWTFVEPGRRTERGPASTGTLVGGLAFADGQLVRFTADGTEVVATLPEQIAPVSPVLTRSGVVVLTGTPSIGLRLWLVLPDGSVNKIADDVTAGFAADPAADVVAYATTPQVQSPPYHSTLHIVSLSDGSEVSTSPDLDFYAAVRGIADGNVVLETGDGASAAVGLWNVESQRIRRWSMYGSAEGTDRVTGVSVLNVGDGPLPILVRFREGPLDVGIVPGEIVVDSSVSQLNGVDFAPGGGLVAGLQPTPDAIELVVLDEASGQIAFRAPLPGGSQTAWSGDDTILVLDKGEPAARVHRCDLTTGECAVAERDLPPAGRFGYGLWLVAGSFEPGSSADLEQVSPSVVATTRCTQAMTSGDFDGDGTLDEAKLIVVVPADLSCDRNGDVYAQMESQQIEVGFGSGQTLDQTLADCQPCLTGSLAFAATDLDGDGRDELAIDVGPGAAIDYVEFYRVDPSGISALVVSEPGDPPYVEPGPAILGGGFDSGLWSPIECRVTVDGTHELVSVHAENLTGPITGPWRVHTTTMVLEGDRLVVTSTNDVESDNFRRTSDAFQNGCL